MSHEVRRRLHRIDELVDGPKLRMLDRECGDEDRHLGREDGFEVVLGVAGDGGP